MRALVYDAFAGPLRVRNVPDPDPAAGGVVIRVAASGICRSDWHAWQGHDASVRLPHVPGHELAGTVESVGAGVQRWRPGDRVTVPFVCACGTCPRCAAGDQQVCDRQVQPGFTHWGSFAELVSITAADVNLVALPGELSFRDAASLGCRFATAFRAVVHQGRVRAGEWLAVHGCGGVGLSAVQIGVQAGARVIAVDISAAALAMAGTLGAEVRLRSYGSADDVSSEIVDLTDGGAHLSLDSFGSPATCAASVECLRPRGRHVQVGLLPPGPGPIVPMDRVLALELEVIGSHGMPAHAYPELVALVAAGRLRPGDLITRELALDQAGVALEAVGASAGTAVITTF